MKKYLLEVFTELKSKLNYINTDSLVFEIPKHDGQGDLSTNIAMISAKIEKRKPREIAEEIIANLKYDTDIICKVEIAGPGFINFFFSPSFIASVVKTVIEKGGDYGLSDKYKGKTANVEFVSANPTGPLTVGHGRNAVIGDTVANMLEAIGYNVDREYYFNNAGRQMRVLGDSVRLRYLQILDGEDSVLFPEEYYQGEYIKDIAALLVKSSGDTLRNDTAEGIFKQTAETEIFKDIVKTLGNLEIKHKTFFNENTLYTDGKIEETLSELNKLNLLYDKDGAKWLKLSELGNDQDKVIIKSTGEPTYRLPDIAYHINKFKRGYDLIVDLFGSDHNATYPDVLAALKALNNDTEKIKVLIHQFVTILQDGEIVKMSTRKANFVTLDELTDEVGKDVVRYFFNMRTIGSHLNFDLALAKKQSDENPVFYLQYAHARICSILRMSSEQELKASLDNLHLLVKDEEQALLKKIHEYPNELLYSAETYEPNRVCSYLESLAAAFHRFYTECRIIGSGKELAEARLALSVAAQITLRNGLSIVGVSAPERM